MQCYFFLFSCYLGVVETTYFSSRDIAAISICAALWGVLNPIFSPFFFRATGLPFLCDLIGFTVLTLGIWWVRKFGAIIVIGLVATVINLAINPTGAHFLGFTAASFVFDILTRIIGYNNIFKNSTLIILTLLSVSIISAAAAGYLIATFFMAGSVLANWGGAIVWVGLHAIGGIIGGSIGVSLVIALSSRIILEKNKRH